MTVNLKYLRYILNAIMLVLHCTALFVTFLFEDYSHYSAWAAWFLFSFSWFLVGSVSYSPKSLASRSDEAHPGMDSLLLRLQFWAGYIGAFLAASVLLGLALN